MSLMIFAALDPSIDARIFASAATSSAILTSVPCCLDSLVDFFSVLRATVAPRAKGHLHPKRRAGIVTTGVVLTPVKHSIANLPGFNSNIIDAVYRMAIRCHREVENAQPNKVSRARLNHAPGPVVIPLASQPEKDTAMFARIAALLKRPPWRSRCWNLDVVIPGRTALTVAVVWMSRRRWVRSPIDGFETLPVGPFVIAVKVTGT